MRPLVPWLLVALCVVIHGAGLMGLSGLLQRRDLTPERHFLSDLGMLVLLSWGIVALHLSEILLWATVFLWNGSMPDWGTAFYFSSMTYTTVGYGDVVPPPQWRGLAVGEALTGILMTGLSTGFFFMVLQRLIGSRFDLKKIRAQDR